MIWTAGRKEKPTHQLKILNATDEVGRVRPSALYVHTICEGKYRALSASSAQTKRKNIISIILIFPKSNLHKMGFSFVKYKWNVSNRIKKLLDAGRSALSRTNIKGSPRIKAGNVPTQLCDVEGVCGIQSRHHETNKRRIYKPCKMVENYITYPVRCP